jgi:hypothetical protein
MCDTAQAVDRSKYPDRAEQALCQDNINPTKKYSNQKEAANNFELVKVWSSGSTLCVPLDAFARVPAA